MNCDLLLHQVLFESSIPCCTFSTPSVSPFDWKYTLAHCLIYGVHYKVRRIERMMNIFLIWFPIKWIRRTQYITSIGLFYKNWGFYLEGVWLWRISGGCSKEMMGPCWIYIWGIIWYYQQIGERTAICKGYYTCLI